MQQLYDWKHKYQPPFFEEEQQRDIEKQINKQLCAKQHKGWE